jgi:hypothetical protein
MASQFDLEEALLGAPVPGRACGGCTVCCEVLAIDTPGFAKPAGSLCVHSRGGGCGIHATRPDVCRAWYCGWRRSADLPEDARPDLSGLLVTLDINLAPRNCLEGVAITVRALREDLALDGPAAQAVIAALSDRLVPVWTSDGAAKTLVHPRAEVAAHVLSGDPPPVRLAAEVAAWRTRYDVFR